MRAVIDDEYVLCIYYTRQQFGAERVGLLTGDVSINRAAANVVVLTTEVFRNMLYDVQVLHYYYITATLLLLYYDSYY